MKVVFLTTPHARADYRERALASWRHVQDVGAEWEIWTDTTGDIDLAGRRAMERALDGHDFGIVAFDDMLVAEDVMSYFRWVSVAFAHQARIASASAWRPAREELGPETYYELQTDQMLRCGVWGTWRNRWDYWFVPHYPATMADIHFTETVYPENHLYEVRPTWSRAQTIGAHGVHMRPDMLEAHTARPWAADLSRPAWEIPSWHLREG